MHIECTCGEGRCLLCDDNGRARHIRVSSDPNKNWENDDIQFPRLLSELASLVSLSQLESLSLSMDLDVHRIEEVFERAEAVWEEIKEKTHAS